MESFDFCSCFNKDMTSEQALHVYVTLYKVVPKNERENLRKAYHEVDDLILLRDIEEIKKGVMF